MDIEKLVIEIRGHVHDAGRAETTCGKHQFRAGLKLLELRAAVESSEGEAGWWSWYETKFTGYIKSRSYAEKLMRWAAADDPDAAAEAHRESARKTMRKIRERTTAHNVVREPNQRVTRDIVAEALSLVAELHGLFEKMSPTERRRLEAAYRRDYGKTASASQLNCD